MSRIGRIAVPVLCLMMDAACILLFFPLSWGLAAAAAAIYVAAVAALPLLHETGHLLGGKMSGYRLLFLRMGPFLLERDAKGRLRASFGKGRGWQCAMVPGRAERGDCPYRLYNFGGILTDLLACALGLAGCLIEGMGTWKGLFFLQLLWAGLPRVYWNGMPDLREGVPTDGYILRLLAREPAARRDYAAYLQVYALCCQGISFDARAYGYIRDPEGNRLFYDALQELLREWGAETESAPGEEMRAEGEIGPGEGGRDRA